jgi:polyhydroxybutyrate depolymerase
MKTILALLATLTLVSCSHAADLATKTWKIDGVERTALVHLPEKTQGAPMIFAFHGHGGNSRNSARKMRLETLWPEAIVIYPQGLPTKTRRDPQGTRPGWMMAGGGFIKNRDLELFDAMLATAKNEWKGDEKRVFATGHSNGAGFVYCLWGQRPDTFAALAPVAGGGARLLDAAKPCPLLAIGAKNDPIVRWETEQLPAIEAAQKLNGDKTTVEVVVHSQGHNYPSAAPEKTIAFFKKFARK